MFYCGRPLSEYCEADQRALDDASCSFVDGCFLVHVCHCFFTTVYHTAFATVGTRKYNTVRLCKRFLYI
ncbi:unnamed protein product [Gongylonema pulchrum]|uniref:Ovule protein n=1 Tax=Gongylonema pulchrum TaxID=637853 RepID=A0A183EYJ0_9BILA|nr:unnamed protein product [Gongylonema pulchrum]